MDLDILKKKLCHILSNSLLIDDVVYYLNEHGVIFYHIHHPKERQLTVTFDPDKSEKENLFKAQEALQRWMYTFSIYTLVMEDTGERTVKKEVYILYKYVIRSKTLIIKSSNTGKKFIYKVRKTIPVTVLKYKLMHENAQLVLKKYCKFLYAEEPNV